MRKNLNVENKKWLVILLEQMVNDFPTEKDEEMAKEIINALNYQLIGKWE